MHLRVAALALGFLVGCGAKQPSAPKLVSAAGRLKNPDGGALAGVHVKFWPLDDPTVFIERHKTLPFAITDENGSFKMRLTAKELGVPPERYKVTLSAFRPAEKSLIPARYTDYDTTPLEILISPDGSSDIAIRVERN